MNATGFEPCIVFAIYAISSGLALFLFSIGISYIIQACRYYYYCYDDCKLDSDNNKEIVK